MIFFNQDASLLNLALIEAISLWHSFSTRGCAVFMPVRVASPTGEGLYAYRQI